MHKHQVSFLSDGSPWSDTAGFSSSWPGPLHGCTGHDHDCHFWETWSRDSAQDWQPAPLPHPAPVSFAHPLYLLEGLQCAGLYHSGPILLGTRDQFSGRQFSTDQGSGDGFRMIQAYYIVHFAFIMITSASPQIISVRSWRLGTPALWTATEN